MSMQAIIRAVCSIIDAFHFATEAAAGAETLPAPTELHSEGALPAPASSAVLDTTHGEDIQRALTRRVLPALQKQLVGLPPCLALAGCVVTLFLWLKLPCHASPIASHMATCKRKWMWPQGPPVTNHYNVDYRHCYSCRLHFPLDMLSVQYSSSKAGESGRGEGRAAAFIFAAS